MFFFRLCSDDCCYYCFRSGVPTCDTPPVGGHLSRGQKEVYTKTENKWYAFGVIYCKYTNVKPSVVYIYSMCVICM